MYLGLRDSNFKYVYVEDTSSSLFPAPEHQWWPGIPSYRGWERCLQTAPPSGQSRGSTIAHQDSSGADLISVVTLDITSLALLLFHFVPPPTFFSVGPIYWTYRYFYFCLFLFPFLFPLSFIPSFSNVHAIFLFVNVFSLLFPSVCVPFRFLSFSPCLPFYSESNYPCGVVPQKWYWTVSLLVFSATSKEITEVLMSACLHVGNSASKQ